MKYIGCSYDKPVSHIFMHTYLFSYKDDALYIHCTLSTQMRNTLDQDLNV